jgi:hypothetical protein
MKRATKRTLAPVLTLAPSPLSAPLDRSAKDCVVELRRLLREALRGELIGVAFAAMYVDRDYSVHAVDEADSSPTFARGMVRALDDHLSERVHRS